MEDHQQEEGRYQRFGRGTCLLTFYFKTMITQLIWILTLPVVLFVSYKLIACVVIKLEKKYPQ